MGPPESEYLDEACQAVREVGHPERLGGIRGASTPGRVPGNHGELAGERIDLPPPLPVIREPTVKQDERWAVPRSLERDGELTDVDPFDHGSKPRSEAWSSVHRKHDCT
jgi:hypothetical protein